ncbi:hypothetical protein HN51_032665 [Arachis hypogaea]|nr:uncharacterized protein DS421_10g308630 [Arachis hypogaea]
MVEITTKIVFVMVFLALVATNGFGLQKTPTNMEPQKHWIGGCNWPGGCNYFAKTCAPFIPVCVDGVCRCKRTGNNIEKTKQERHNRIDGEKQN